MDDRDRGDVAVTAAGDRALNAPDDKDRTGAASLASWSAALDFVARRYGVGFSPGRVRRLLEELSSDHSGGDAPAREKVEQLAGLHGLSLGLDAPAVRNLSHLNLPVIVELQDGGIAVVDKFIDDANVSLVLDAQGKDCGICSLEDLARSARAVVSPRPKGNVPDARVDDYIRSGKETWLRRLVLRDLRPYGYVMVASLVANALALSGILFSMQVYDRVVPAESMSTLHVLFIGVLLAVVFSFLLRHVRAQIIDLVGKQADMRLSDVVFGHALRVTNKARPKSTGTFISQLRDLEHVRETMTSTTVAAIADLPFFLLFLCVFWFIGGPLVAVPIAALVLLVVPGILAQGALRESASQSMREASLRNATLVETIQGIEDIKSLQAEERFQQKWNHFNAVTAQAQLRSRRINGLLSAWSHAVQTCVFATTVYIGAPMVMAGDMTTGSLVACSILGSRMMGPIGQLTGVMSRLQQAKLGFRSVVGILEMPVDHPERETRISHPEVQGAYSIEAAAFHYEPDSAFPALTVRELSIEPGERIALLGRNGAGKSTLLQALSGMLPPTDGQVLLDGLTLSQIDTADARHGISILTQQSRLFHGTIRENLMLGAPHATEKELIDILAMVGALEFVGKLPRGLDHPILEGGRGLSGGQLQALLLARLLIRSPKVVLLDEPTAAMDEATERNFITRFQEWSVGRTVVVATHRMRVLDMVSRVVVLEGGKVVLDDRKDSAIETLRGVKREQPPRSATSQHSVRELQKMAEATVAERAAI